jgi:hypothetical protein
VANHDRTPGSYGCRPRDRDRRVPVFEHYLRPWEGPVRLATGTLPPAPAQVDRESLVTDWPMYVNGPDPANPPYAPAGLGDCFWAGAAHAFTAERVYAGWPQVLFSSAAIITGYGSTGYIPGNSSTDQGTDPAQGLKYLSTTGLTDVTGMVHKVGAYAFFADPRNFGLVRQALDTFGSVGVSFGCTQSYEDAFAAGQVAQWVPGSPVVGGHWVVIQQYRASGTGVIGEITWGQVQSVTLGCFWHTVTDVAAIASRDFITRSGASVQGLDFDQLCADTEDAE